MIFLGLLFLSSSLLLPLPPTPPPWSDLQVLILKDSDHLGCLERGEEWKSEKLERINLAIPSPCRLRARSRVNPQRQELPMKFLVFFVTLKRKFTEWRLSLFLKVTRELFLIKGCLTKIWELAKSSFKRVWGRNSSKRQQGERIELFSAYTLLSFSFSRLNLKCIKTNFCFKNITHHNLTQANKKVKFICF